MKLNEMSSIGLLLTVSVCQAVTQPTVDPLAEPNSFRVTPYVQRPATNAVTLMWLAQTNGSASVSWWVQGGSETNAIPSATEIAPTDRVANMRFIYYSDSETEPADNPPSTGRTTDWTDPKTGQNRTYYATQTEAYASNLAAVDGDVQERFHRVDYGPATCRAHS